MWSKQNIMINERYNNYNNINYLHAWVSEVAQSCLTLCNPINCSLPGSSIHGIFQARVLEWVAISFSRGSSQPRDWTQVSHIACRRFTIWATREAQLFTWHSIKGKTRRTEIIFSVLRGWGGEKELSPKGLEGKFGVMKMFSVLIVEATAWPCKFVKIHWPVYQRKVKSMICKL